MSSARPKEIPVCGLAAVQAVFERDPDCIRRLFFDQETSRRVGRLTSYLAAQKRIYRVVPAEELAKVAGTVHHGGIVAVMEARPLERVTAQQLGAWATKATPLLILDRVGNAHNLGAIARSAAFFGISDVVVPTDPAQALPGEAAHRVAEGGMAHMHFWQVQDLAVFCRDLAQSYEVVGASVGVGSRPLHKWRADYNKRPGRPLALVLGNEEHGINAAVARACSALVWIPGHAERVESLNVSVAAAILMWEFWGSRVRSTTSTAGKKS